MPFEKFNPTILKEKIIDFSNIPAGQSVNRFVLEGPLQDQPRSISVAAGLFPARGLLGKSFSVIALLDVPDDQKRVQFWYSRIRELQIPNHVSMLNIPDTPEIQGQNIQICKRNSLPFISIMFGKYIQSGNSVVALHCVHGLSPQTALKKFQENARNNLTSNQ